GRKLPAHRLSATRRAGMGRRPAAPGPPPSNERACRGWRRAACSRRSAGERCRGQVAHHQGIMKTTYAALWIVLMPAMLMAGEAVPAFTRKPTATKAGDAIKLEFTSDRATDVTVTVEDAHGKIVRHLAAGVLGKNAPEPLQPNTLAQSLTWDGKDDFGK